MKTLYSTLIATCIGVSAFAQSNILDAPKSAKPLNPVQKSVNPYARQQRQANPTSTQATMSFYTDYGFMDDDFQVNTQGFTYERYIWDMNMRYDLANGDTSLRWGTVDFNPLYDSYNGSVQIASTSYNSITIDTIFFNAGHSNYSGQNDTLLIHIVQCTAAGYPTTTALILHTDTIISNTSLTGSTTWLSNGTFFTTPGYTINSNTTKFAVKVEYYGSTQDTFGLTAGFGDMGITCSANPTLPNFAALSNYAPNSYRHDMRFAGPPNNLPQLPTSTGADTYYECDGASGHLLGSDSENYLQNWDIWIHATISGVGINETNGSLGVGQNYPNPSTGETEIPYQLKNNSTVTLSICDVTGKEVMTQKENATAGSHTFKVSSANLSAGVYYYTVSTPEGSMTRKMIVAQ